MGLTVVKAANFLRQALTIILPVYFPGLKIQNHPDFIALEIFRTTAAFAPDLGREILTVYLVETQRLKKIFRHGKGKQSMDADLPGFILHKFNDSASEPQMLVIRMNRQSANLGDVLPEYMQAPAGHQKIDYLFGIRQGVHRNVFIDGNDEIPDVLI